MTGRLKVKGHRLNNISQCEPGTVQPLITVCITTGVHVNASQVVTVTDHTYQLATFTPGTQQVERTADTEGLWVERLSEH